MAKSDGWERGECRPKQAAKKLNHRKTPKPAQFRCMQLINRRDGVGEMTGHCGRFCRLFRPIFYSLLGGVRGPAITVAVSVSGYVFRTRRMSSFVTAIYESTDSRTVR